MSCFSPYVPTLFHTMVSKFIFEVWLCNLCYATKQSLKVMWTTDLNLLINQKPPLQTLKCSSRESVLIVFQVLWIQTEQLCANIQTKYRHFLLHSKPQNKTHLASETKSFTSNWAFSFVYILVFAFRDTCFRLNHQLPSFALEVLGCHQWRRFFFLVHKSVCLCLFPSGPNSFHYQSISETVNMHLDCGGALAPHCLEANWRFNLDHPFALTDTRTREPQTTPTVGQRWGSP